MARIYVLLGALAVIGTLTGSAYIKGRWDGAAAEVARALAEIQDLNRQLQEADRAAQEREQVRLGEIERLGATIEQLRREADEDPDADNRAIGPGSVRRINSVE